MRIKMKTIMAGPQGVYDIGTIIDMPRDKALAMVAAGYAERHQPDEEIIELPDLEAAAIERESETAVQPAARKRKGG